MTRRYYLLDDADRRITKELEYTREAGADVARRFYDRVKAGILGLIEMPHKGKRFESAHPELHGLRYWLVRGFPFHIYYREVEDGIEVIHLLHAAEDRDEKLGPNPRTLRA